jgi:hypothetical protein
MKSGINKLLTKADRISECEEAYMWSTSDEMDCGTA